MASGTRLARLTMLSSAGLLISQAAQAQDAGTPAVASPPVVASEAGKQVYVLADFAQFSPRTADDMLFRVPGFKYQGGSQERGLGQATENVLINGQSVTNKTGGAIDELSKISAKQVDRIEIVDATSLKIPGLTGQVANVITKADGKGSGQFSWSPSINIHYGDPAYRRGNISYSGKKGRVSYTLGLDTYGSNSRSNGPTIRYDGAGQPTEYRDERSLFAYDAPKGSTRLTLSGPVSGSMNLSYQIVRNNSSFVSNHMPVAGTASSQSSPSRNQDSNFDVGGDLSLKVPGGKLKLIGLLSRHDSDSAYSSTTIIPGAPATGSKVDGGSHAGEMVGRAEYGLKLGGADLQLSGEAAYNSLDGSSRLFDLDTGGAYAEIPFPGATLKVEESRYELLTTYGRPIAKGVTLQLVAGGEHSTLSAGPVSRDFLRYKGSAALAWQAGKRTDISLKLARAVEQLNFYSFLASINLVDQRQTEGNTSLVPAQTWQADLELNRKLNAWGSTRIRLYGLRMEDILETIPVGNRGQAQGNVDHARRYGVEWQATLLFDPIGWKGARLNMTVALERSRVRDPLTGVPRSLSYNMVRQIFTNLRHDIAGSDWAWGASLSSFSFAPGVQPTQVSSSRTTPARVGAYVENKDIFGLRVSAQVDNIANARNHGDRTVYDGWRIDPILFREVSNRPTGTTVSFSVSGSF